MKKKEQTKKLTIELNEKILNGITFLKDRYNIFDDKQIIIFAIQELAFREEDKTLDHKLKIRKLLEDNQKARKELEQ